MKPDNQSISNIVGPVKIVLAELLGVVLDYFYIPCPNENCKDEEDAFLVEYNDRIECNFCDEYSTEAFTISLEFD